MDTIILLSTNYSGYTANITFNPLIGGTIALGQHQIPYLYTADNIYGTYDLYFSSWTKTCSTSISPQLVTIIANTSTFSLQIVGTVSQINWGDGSPLETLTNGQLVHSYPSTGIYNISFLPVNLINLVIDGNGITSISQLPNTVKLLDISNNNLNSLYIDNLLNITYLKVTNNNLSVDNVSNLINLTNLYYDGNNISSINLTNLTNLIDLNLSNNNLTSLDFTNQVNLTTLECANNNISTLVFDNTFTNNYFLNFLNVSNNSLTNLDFTNSYFDTLSYVDFSYNDLTSFYTISTISTLDCNNNNLTNLDFDVSTNLTFLNCSHNQLTLLDTGFVSGLILANISYNQLDTTNINNILINLQNNGLTNGQVLLNNQTPSACPSGDGIFAEFYLIDVQGWTVTVDAGCSGTLRISFNTSYAYWYIAGSDIFDMYINWGDGSPVEHYITDSLEISHSFLTVPATATIVFSDNTLITQINLIPNYGDLGAYNNVTNITGLDILTNLQYLSLDGNLFSTFNSTLPNSLLYLGLNYNQLTTFDSSILPNSLLYLALNYNQLTTFDSSTLSNSIITLYLAGNQLTLFSSVLPSSIAILVLSNNQLTSFTSTLPNSLTTLNLNNNQLTQTSFNNVLINLSGNGTSNGTVNLYYQTPLVCPTGNGIIAKDYLTNTLNWNVIIDVDCYPYVIEILFDTDISTTLFFSLYTRFGPNPGVPTSSSIDYDDNTSPIFFNNSFFVVNKDYEVSSGIKTIKVGITEPSLYNSFLINNCLGVIGINNLNQFSGISFVQFAALGCSLPQSSVNYILTTLSGFSVTYCDIVLDNQTPLACPTGDGILAKNYLLGLNNTVTTDVCQILTIDLDVYFAPGSSFGAIITGDTSFYLLFDWNDGTTSAYTGNNIIVNKSYSTVGSHNVTISVTGATNINYIDFQYSYAVTNLGQFDTLTNLNYLNVSEHKLTSLPELPNSITYLNLSGNRFDNLAIENTINSFTGYSWTTPFINLSGQQYGGCLPYNTTAYTNYQTLIGNGWTIYVVFCPFTSDWLTTNPNEPIELPLSPYGNYNFTVNWGDGNVETITSYLNNSHVYINEGQYTVTITGTIDGWSFYDEGLDEYFGTPTKLINVLRWGCLGLGNRGGGFFGTNNLTLDSVSDILNLQGVTNLDEMFNGSSITTVNRINEWDVSGVNSMFYMFTGSQFNQPINNWNVSGVTNMSYMFYNATQFNRDLSSWCVTNIPSLPTGFDTGASSWVLPKPVWGTCPP